MVNKKSLLLAIFGMGVITGVIAKEVSENGLYIFKSGDPIVASEVNANFDFLLQKIVILEAKLASYERE